MKMEDAFDRVKKAVQSGRYANAYLITGSIRGGAQDLAIKILQLLFCSAQSKPCGACNECRKVAERIEVDVHWVFPEKKSRIIGVDQVRKQIIVPMTQTALGGGWKATVVVGADCFKTEAANAFLKTLEEPTPKTIFLLLSDTPQKLLPTVVSRCQRIDLNDARELPEPWRTRVLDVLAGPLFRNSIEKFASANILLSLLDELKDHAKKLVADETREDRAKGEIDEDDDVIEAKISARYREFRECFLVTLMHWFRDLLILEAGGDDGLVFNKEHLATLKERAGNLQRQHVLYNLRALDEMDRQFKSNMNQVHIMAYAIDRLQHGVK